MNTSTPLPPRPTRYPLAALLLCLPGCAGDGWQHPWTKANPATIVRLGPFQYHNSKDVNLQCDEFEGEDAAGRHIKLKGFSLITSASGPRTADVLQTEAMTNLTRTILQPVNHALELAAPIVAAKVAQPGVERGNPLQEAVRDRAAEAIRTPANPWITPPTPPARP